MSETIVIFRKDRTGWREPFALFPELPADQLGIYCDSYQHVGQHCAADYHGCIANSRPAMPEEAAPLLAELKCIGYEPRVLTRASRRHHDARLTLAREGL